MQGLEARVFGSVAIAGLRREFLEVWQVKYFAGNGGNWRLNGCGGGLNGFRGFETNRKKAKSKPAPLKEGCGTPYGLSPLTVLHPITITGRAAVGCRTWRRTESEIAEQDHRWGRCRQPSLGDRSCF